MKLTIIIFLVYFSLLSCTTKNQIKQLNTPNKLDVVQACLDSSRHYRKVISIQSRTSYLETASDYQPIAGPKGYISWDYTKDGYLDYIFIEKQQRKYIATGNTPEIHLVICKSQIKNGKLEYKRFIPNFTLYESFLPDFQAESHSIRKEKELLVISRNYHEDNWGSDSSVNIYRFNTKINDFILTEQHISSSSGDGYRDDIQEVYKYTEGTLLKALSCGQYSGPCASSHGSYSFFKRRIKLSEQKNFFKPQISQISLIAIINKP